MGMSGKIRGVWLTTMLVLLFCAVIPRAAYGRHGSGGEDRLGLFSEIVVSEEHPAGDVVCAFCTIEIEGDVRSDVTVAFSTVSVADGRTISGDVTTLFSTLVVGEGARINGDLTTVLSTASLAESAQVQGDRNGFGSGLGVMVLLAPLLIAAGVLWLIVWIVRRMLF